MLFVIDEFQNQYAAILQMRSWQVISCEGKEKMTKAPAKNIRYGVVFTVEDKIGNDRFYMINEMTKEMTLICICEDWVEWKGSQFPKQYN